MSQCIPTGQVLYVNKKRTLIAKHDKDGTNKKFTCRWKYSMHNISKLELGIVAHPCNSSTETEVGELWVHSPVLLCSPG
jgi:hypothetical protein